MRSAVSAILSGTVPEQSMSYPDYQQTPHDHQTLLVVVRHIGRQLRTKQFNRAFDRISRVSQIKIQDPQNNSRTIWIRFVRSYPAENNDWGDFQTHRKVLGLISIGQCNSQDELNELCRIHESLKVKYTWTLYDSRCILFGINTDGTVYDEQHSSEGSPSIEGDGQNLFSRRRTRSGSGEMSSLHYAESPSTSIASSDMSTAGVVRSSSYSSDTLHCLGISTEEVSEINDTASEDSASRSESVTGTIQYATIESQERAGSSNLKPLVTPGNFKARTLFYPTMDMSQGLEADMDDFVKALFWVLESKRVDKLGLRKADRSLLLSALCAPFEKKDFVGLDLESKNNKKRADGRLKKQLGDLNLQAGLPAEAITHYQSAIEILKSVNDWLWLGGALEGVCSSSVCILYPQLRRFPTLQRNSSLQGMELAKMKHVAMNAGNSNSLPPGLDPATEISGAKAQVKNCLSPREIQEKYQEAVMHYGKYRQAGVIETEASIKAALVLIEQKQTLPAADFLQNAVFISLQLTEEEKMQRFNALSELYSRLGFHRKAAFFKRVAAMRCVSPSNPQPNWNLCHSLLLQLLDGYNLCIDPNESEKFGYYGWARLQIQVLQELVGTAKKKGNNSLATRHMTLLLHSMLPHLSGMERGEFALQLEMLSKDGEGIPTPIALENGLIVPPVHLSTIPLLKVFKLVQPTPHLRPQKIEVKNPNDEISPFVYTPFAANRNKDVKDATKADFCWVEGEMCEVNIILENPLPIELKLSSICLITEGVGFHVNSNVISIPAESAMFPATLTGIPLGPGNLRILGYSTYTLGVKSNIRLKNLRVIKCPHVDVEIVAALPFIEIETSKPKSEFFSSFSDSIVTSASVSLLMGETQECMITLTNTAKVPIETLEISIDSRIDKRISEIFSWSDETLQAQLPIPPGGSASFNVHIYGAGDFIGQPDYNACDTSSTSSLPPANTNSEGPSSLPSRLGAISERLRSSAGKRTESRSSGKSGGSFNSFSAVTPKLSLSSYSKTYEAVLKLKYSGGPGTKTGHYRTCGVALNVEVTPALFITKWDTLPGESPSQFYIVLDICNTTQHEMELHYAGTKQILVEKLETCRIPIPLDKCSVADIEKGKEEITCSQHIVNNTDVKWILPDCSGKATLDGIRLTSEMVQLAIVSPIEWEITINGEMAKAEEMHFEAGEMINVDVCLKNHMRDELQDVRLSLACYQDYQNGRCNYRLDSRVAVIGNEAVLIPQIGPGNSFQHSVSLIFFVSGVYKVDFKCNRKDTNVLSTETGTKSQVFHQFVWKYNPPLDFQIN